MTWSAGKNRYNAWLEANNDHDWSIIRLTDAQKLSLIAIVASASIIAYGWYVQCTLFIDTENT